MSGPTERDYLKYTGNRFPRVLRLAWTLFFIFSLYYLVANLLPDLKEWWARL